MASVASTVVATSSRGKAMVAPLGVAGAVLAGAAYLALADPSQGGWYPACPFHAVTGWWCPGCGMTRAAGALVRGHIGAAVSYNLLAIVVVPMALYGWLSWMGRAAGRPRLPALTRLPPAVWTVGVVVAVSFAVLRNLPWEPFTHLAP